MRILAVLTALIALAWATWATWASGPQEGKPAAAAPADPDHAAKMAKGLDLFKKHVRQVLVDRCVKCHGGKETESGFDLTDRDRLLKGGDSGPAVLLGRGRDSRLYQLVTHAKEPKMPFQGRKLPEETAKHLAEWIDLGAPYDKPLVERKEIAAWTQKAVDPQARQFWSFQPLQKVEPPGVKNDSWGRTPIDQFILAKLEAAGIAPNPPVGKRQLIRRAYLDLLGLPPPPEEVEAFVNDPSPDAYEKLLDKLLKSPHYGERWGRHWLDLARFAESHGFEHDYDRPSAYHYRDFVIRALNQDMPYDQFVKWQIAGDEFAPDDNLALTATGFLAAGVHSTQITAREVEKHRYDEMDDKLATIGTAMLGLTIGCARCHDHKFDPIPQRDYYQLLATFTTTVRSEIDLVDPAAYLQVKERFDREHEPYVAAVKKFEAEQLPARGAKLAQAWSSGRQQWALVDALPRGGVLLTGLVEWRQTTDLDWLKLKKAEIEHLRKAPKKDTVKALIASEGLAPVRLHTQGGDFFNETHFLRRGDTEQKEGAAQQSFLQVLMQPATEAQKRWQVEPPKGWRTSYRRVALANWITDVDQGAGQLLARVIVNRLWQHHLGRGLVATPSDFGTRGEKPTHPELLDWLASELIRNGWRLKPIHTLIMSSAVYRQSSQVDDAKLKVDPDNRLCWRRPKQRLEGEIIRDAMLSISGLLDAKPFGPGTLDENSKRRSIYFTVKRSKLMPMMVVFDAPEALVSVGDRPTTTIAPQALLLMNNPQVRGYAQGFAKRIAGQTPLEEAVRHGYLIALARPPTLEELADSIAFVQQQMQSYKANGKEGGKELALADFCQVLMCLNEFVYVE